MICSRTLWQLSQTMRRATQISAPDGATLDLEKSKLLFRKNAKKWAPIPSIHPSFCPSIHTILTPGLSESGRHYIQLFWGHLKFLPGQMRDIFLQHDQVFLRACFLGGNAQISHPSREEPDKTTRRSAGVHQCLLVLHILIFTKWADNGGFLKK